MSVSNTWLLVPVGAHLEVRVVVPGDANGNRSNASAQITRDGVTVPPGWKNSDLRPGPARLDIDAAVDFVVELPVRSLDVANIRRAEVHATVLMPGGDQPCDPHPLILDLLDPLQNSATLTVIAA